MHLQLSVIFYGTIFAKVPWEMYDRVLNTYPPEGFLITEPLGEVFRYSKREYSKNTVI